MQENLKQEKNICLLLYKMFGNALGWYGESKTVCGVPRLFPAAVIHLGAAGQFKP